ncbi:DUF2975 domain-containing protein [Rhodohalobacter sp.]|uniref:DUF2975 domain-containing protein n=1 Tax=Rhodohalobacter sp. TaxID=1974210 RepID=UPI002ACE8B7F|nr:DUF2975 domain-containing protein [Rhodohalobacter sp.]MDZ7758416.1 DUF2975 domain-containing protein [Rhodohalobacter sp.]
MSLPNKFSILVWTCNLTLVVLSAIIIASGYYYSVVPGLVGLDNTFEGATKYSSRWSQNFLSDHFLFEQIVDKEKDIDTENYYFASTWNLYQIPITDSVRVEVNKIDEELSSSESNFAGIVTKKVTVSEPAGTLPVRLAAPAIPLEREQYISLARSNILFFALTAIYTLIFVWFLRRFVSGLRKPDFFNRKNSRTLYITASLVLMAPFLMWGWFTWIRPDLFSGYIIGNASALDTGSPLPGALIVFGVILFVIAWCFDQGVKLQKEQELTI